MSDYRTLWADALKANSQMLIQVLAEQAINEVVISYAGRDGVGGIEELIVQPTTALACLSTVTLSYACVVGEYQGDDYRCETVVRTFQLESALRDFTLTWLEYHQANWEIEEGSEGKVTLRPASHYCQLCHTAFVLQHLDYCYAL